MSTLTENRVRLALGDASLTLDIGTAAATTRHSLPIGLARLAAEFGQRMPTALSLEQAIALVEDAVMPAASYLPAGLDTLRTQDPLIHQLIASATGVTNMTHARQASTEAIESLFSALVRQAEQAGHIEAHLPQSAQAAAALLILRECLHHWGMRQVRFG